MERTSSILRLVLARMALLVDESRSVLPLRSVKEWELWRENVRARLGPFHLNWPEPVLFDRPAGPNGQIKTDLRLMKERARGGGEGVLGSIFAGYVPLAPQNPYPIIVYFVANYRPHLSHF